MFIRLYFVSGVYSHVFTTSLGAARQGWRGPVAETHRHELGLASIPVVETQAGPYFARGDVFQAL